MKVKFSVIPFIPAALAMIALRVMSIFGADDNGKLFGMDKMVVAYTTIGISLALFLVCIIINIFDRKTAPVYPVQKNIPAGVLSILSGAMVIAGSVGTFMNTTPDSSNYVMALVCALFSLPAGIAFFLMSRVHFVGKSVVSAVSVLYVFPALWGCAQLVHEFLEATKVSISATDLSSLFCYIFATLYYFSHAMVASRIKGRNPVKGCFIYGLPAVGLLISNGLYTYFTGIQEGTGYVSSLNAAKFIVLALYAGSFILEMFFHSVSKDELEIIDGLASAEVLGEEEKKYIRTEEYEDMVFSERGADAQEEGAMPEVPVFDEIETITDFAEEEVQQEAVSETEQADSAAPAEEEAPAEQYQSQQSLDDFIIGYQAPKDYEPIPYFTKKEKDKEQSGESSTFVTGIAQHKEEKEEGKSEKSGGFMKKLFKKKSDSAAETDAGESQTREPVTHTERERAPEGDIELVNSPGPAQVSRTERAHAAHDDIELVNSPGPAQVSRTERAHAAYDDIELVNAPSPERTSRAKRQPAVETDFDIVSSPNPDPVRRRPLSHRPVQPKKQHSSRSDDIDALLRELDDKEKRS